MQIRVRHYGVETASHALHREPVLQHPLDSSLDKVSPVSGKGVAERGYSGLHQLSKRADLDSFEDGRSEEEIQDPLGARFQDPLGLLSSQDSPSADASIKLSSKLSKRGDKSLSDERAEAAAAEWDAFKYSIMQRFTSTGTITVSATFDILSKEPKGRGKSVTAAHLQELEDPGREAREETKIISQQEYVTRLKELNEEISQAWMNNERVSALRLSIKVARLLSDTSVPQFYPTLFVLVTDVMDTVGNLVWNRIKGKAECDEGGKLIATLPVNFTADDVRQEAKETCFNWFYKIGSIKELLPRIYLELAIIRCMLYLERDPPVATFHRLNQMIRGLADPLASAYLHLYLTRRSQAVIPVESSSSGSIFNFSSILDSLELPLPSSIPQNPRVYLVSGLKDYLILYRRLLSGELDAKYTRIGVNRRLAMMLVEPVFEWIMLCIFKQANQEEMAYLLSMFSEVREEKKSTNTSPPISVVVHHLLKNLPAIFVSNNALNISMVIKSAIDLAMPQSINYRLLGTKLCECSPPREFRLTVLNDIWRVVMKYSDLVEYLSVADVFLEYILQNCSEDELLVMLRDIVKHLRRGDMNDGVLPFLESMIFKLLTHYKDLNYVLTLANFVDILDFLYGDTRVSVYKRILSSVSSYVIQLQGISLFEAASFLHDSLDSLSSDDDRRQITRLIVRYVQLVDFGPDLEQHLAFLVDCRGAFADMDSLRVTLVHASNRFAMTTLKMVRGIHNKRTGDFVKACITFNEITVPSINSVLARLNLFLETAEVALMNALPSHAESCAKYALTTLQDLMNGDDTKNDDELDGISTFFRKLSAFLIVMPGHPEHGGLYIVEGFLNVLDAQPWLTPERERLEVLCGVLSMLAALSQERQPYHVQNTQVDSNDCLFYGRESYRQEVEFLCQRAVEMISSTMYSGDSPAQDVNALSLLTVLLQVFSIEKVGEICSDLVGRGLSVSSKKDQFLQTFIELCEQRTISLSGF